MLNPPPGDEPTGAPWGHRAAVVALCVALAAVTVAAVVTAPAPPGVQSVAEQPSPAPAARCDFPAGGAPALPVSIPADRNAPVAGTEAVIVVTSAGPIPLTLDRGRAPCSISSLGSLQAQGYFNATACHRLTTQVIFVLQCGDPTGTGSGGPGYTVPDELPTPPAEGGTAYPRGTVAMSNAGYPGTGGSQFFLVYRDSPLPPVYTVLGTVDEVGLATLDRVAAAGTATGSPDAPPARGVSILEFSWPT